MRPQIHVLTQLLLYHMNTHRYCCDVFVNVNKRASDKCYGTDSFFSQWYLTIFWSSLLLLPSRVVWSTGSVSSLSGPASATGGLLFSKDRQSTAHMLRYKHRGWLTLGFKQCFVVFRMFWDTHLAAQWPWPVLCPAVQMNQWQWAGRCNLPPA